MNICIANPPAYFKDHNRHFIQAGSRWSFSMDAPKGNHKWPHYQPFPFSLAYATSIFKDYGKAEVDAFDACALDMDGEEFVARVRKSDPEILYTEVPTVSFPLMMEVLDELSCSIYVCGSHVAALPHSSRHYQEHGGEWEGFLVNGFRPFNRYPFPDREFFPNEQYSNFEFYRPTVQVLTSRGCPHQCSFCLERHVTHASPSVDCREPDKVVDEIEMLSGMGAKQIWFDDLELTARRDHVEGLCNAFLNEKPGIPWTCFGDVLAKPETIRLMAKAGCIGLAFGVETITPESLKLVNKGWITPERVWEFAKLLRSEGVHSHASYSIGLPGETRESIMKTLEFAFSLETDSLQFSIATPFPGCLHPDTLIELSDGRAERIEKSHSMLTSVNGMELCPSNGTKGVRFHHGSLIELKTVDKEIKTTPDHAFFTWEKEDGFRAIQAKDLKRNMRIVVSSKAIKITSNEDMNPLIAQILGFYTGDGNLIIRRRPKPYYISYITYFTDKDKENLGIYRNLIKEVFDCNPAIQEPPSGRIRLRVYSKNLAKQISANGLACHSYKREIPESIECGSDNIIASFLRGLFDAEGSVFVNETNLCLYNSNINLIRGAKWLLHRLGIDSKIHVKKPSGFSSNEKYRLIIKNRDSIRIFSKIIGFSHPKKDNRLNELCQKLVLLKDGYGVGNRQYWPISGSLALQRITSVHEITYDGLVYDYNVPGYDNYIASGFMVHNTPFYKMCDENGWLITDDWTRYDGARYCVVDYPQLKHDEIEDLFRYAMGRREDLNLGFRKR